MRTMIARTTPEKTYHDPSEAICASGQADAMVRALSDEQVRGKMIRRIIWDDATLAFELDGGLYLNIVAQAGRIVGSLDGVSAAAVRTTSDDDVMFELDGREIKWHRAEVGRKYIGKPIERLWFGNNTIFIYVQQAVLACHLVESCEEGKPWLFWTESE
jgi:hypothetical protein